MRLEQGEELAVVSRILGHSSIATTADVYGHLTEAMLGDAGLQEVKVGVGARKAGDPFTVLIACGTKGT